MKLSIATGAIADFENSKFRHFDLTLGGVFVGPYLNEKFDEAVERLKATCARLGADIPQAHAPYSLNPCKDQETMDNQVKIMEKILLACGKLGIDRITLHSGFGFSENKEEMMQKNTAYYKRLIPMAEEHNVTLMIENISEEIYHDRFVIETADDILDLRSRLGDHRLIGACWDSGHANTKALDQYENITKLKGILKGVHLHDNHGDTDDHMPPLLGTVNFDDVVKALLDIGYDGAFNLESHIFGGGWPNYRRKQSPFNTEEARLFTPDDELRRYGYDFMYGVGEYLMKKYNIDIE